ncbi:reverse transcriptase domain-containing protein [Tanacetum coccineum]|uniref:Reverse transcriptase domain-containing protein n=1 Tax=Tanacetum coccineum TaxID=301880 RepID=A0ABQ5AQ27_9ASTR
MSVRLAERSFQYPIGIAENMLVEVGKFTFPANFVILEMEEDSKVSLILGRPFLHTADAVIRVKQKQLNLGVRTERMIFNIESAIKHSYSNDDTCFSIDVIDEILEEDFDALLDEGSEILHSIEGTILEEKLFAEFNKFMAMTADENSKSESDTEEPPFDKITFNIDYKIKTSLEEPPTDLELKPLPDNLEYVFLEEPLFLPIIISSQLFKENKNKLIYVLKKHKRAFSWKTTDIPGICPSFCKHKIQLQEDKKAVVQKQRRLNPNMQEVVKKEIVKLLDTWIIYLIADSPWVCFIHCVPRKGVITVVTNERNELVPTRTVTGWCMLAIFHDMIEESVEVFMDDFSVFGSYFDHCLNNLNKMLQRCEDAHLVLNWEKCHFMVKEGIDRKGTENVIADHLSRIKKEETSDDSEVDDNFPGETLMEINTEDYPWFADFANYLVIAVDYVSKWAKAQALLTNDARVVITFLKKLFCRFRMPKALISDRGTHFCNKIMEKTMKRYGVNHQFSTSYHPQTSGQVENTNRALKRIFEKTVKDNSAIWSRKLDDVMWAFRTAYKTPTGTTSYKLVYGKNCHLPFKIEHRAYWALKNCNPDLIVAGEKQMFQLHELDELKHQVYENARLYKARTKVWQYNSNMENYEIPIDLMDQETTTFTCPFGMYAYIRMPFGLCNAPATFQRYMLAIFHDMIKESVKVFMDDFSVFGSSFDHCLNNLDKMLQRCEDAHLVLN